MKQQNTEKLFYISDLIKATGVSRPEAHRLLPRPRFAFTAEQFRETVAAVNGVSKFRQIPVEPVRQQAPSNSPVLTIADARKATRVRW